MRDHVVFGANQGQQGLAVKIIFFPSVNEFVVKFNNSLLESDFLGNLKGRMAALGLKVLPNEVSYQQGFRKFSARIEQKKVNPEDVWEIMMQLNANLQGMDDKHLLREGDMEVMEEDMEVMEVRTGVNGGKNEISKVCRVTEDVVHFLETKFNCLLYTSPSPRDLSTSRMPSSA